MSDRKYALTRVALGDFLLPSNDGQTIWRIAKYMDGRSSGLEFPDREFWGIWKWNGPVNESTYVDTGDWSLWEAWDLGMYETRAEVVKAALR